jgi:hypothetical protein
MKLVKNFALTVLLTFVLAASAPAGETGMPGSPAPAPPAPATGSKEEKSACYGDPVAADTTAETSDYLLYEALAALLSVY